MGHALNGSIQDVLIRWHRMRGFDTLWQPGYDHAGIATQNVVEKELAKEGLTRHDLGREAFVERDLGVARALRAARSWASSAASAPRSTTRRERFTMDEGYVRAVLTLLRPPLGPRLDLPRQPDRQLVPVPPDRDLRPRGRARGRWTTRSSRSATRFADGDGRDGITIATVRPATILADVAVAVHPDDARYRDLVGREVIVPFVERRVPVIARRPRRPRVRHRARSRSRPGHDPMDFEIGRDHGLPEPIGRSAPTGA